MAAKKKLPVPKNKPPAQSKKLKYAPVDYLRGGKTKGHTIGENYTAWNTYGQGRPDFGKEQGPGEPYHEVQKKVQKPLPGPDSNRPPWARLPSPAQRNTLPYHPPGQAGQASPWLSAVRRRLMGVK